METLYLYAITDEPALPLPVIGGVGGNAVSRLRCGDLQAVVSPLTSGHVDLTTDRLLQHEGVIEALMERHAVLPVRFGTLTVAPRIVQELDRHRVLFAERLVRVRHRVEIGLRVLWPTSEEDPSPRLRASDRVDGQVYMRALMAEAQRSRLRREQIEALAVQLTTALADLVDVETHEVQIAPWPLLKAAYLVRREQVSEMQRRIVALQERYADLVLLATGPWPAYSFADIRLHDAALLV